jgi:hypothetical protein
MTGTNVRFLFPKAVREQVLGQHQELRELLSEAMERTTRELKDPGNDALVPIALEIRRRMHAHMAYEERSLFPVLLEADLWGPERVGALLAEHGRQRAELDTMVEGVRSGWDDDRVALVLRSLVADILVDMAEEEAGPLSRPLLNDEILEVTTREVQSLG